MSNVNPVFNGPLNAISGKKKEVFCFEIEGVEITFKAVVIDNGPDDQPEYEDEEVYIDGDAWELINMAQPMEAIWSKADEHWHEKVG